MTRAARAIDIPAIEALVRDQHARSKYAGRVEISDKVMRSLFEAAVAGQNQTGPQATFLRVAEEDGRIVAFMLGTLARVYHIGNKLAAMDMFLCAYADAKATHALRLVSEYLEWAKSNPKVIEIILSWHNALPGAERMAQVFEHKGMVKVGEMYELRLGESE